MQLKAAWVCTIIQSVCAVLSLVNRLTSFLVFLSGRVPGYKLKSWEEEKPLKNGASPGTTCFFYFSASSPHSPILEDTVKSLGLLLPNPKQFSLENYNVYKSRETSVMNLHVPLTFQLQYDQLIPSLCHPLSHPKHYVILCVNVKVNISQR